MNPTIFKASDGIVGLVTFDNAMMTSAAVADFLRATENHLRSGKAFVDFDFTKFPFVKHFHVQEGTLNIVTI